MKPRCSTYFPRRQIESTPSPEEQIPKVRFRITNIHGADEITSRDAPPLVALHAESDNDRCDCHSYDRSDSYRDCYFDSNCNSDQYANRNSNSRAAAGRLHCRHRNPNHSAI